MSPVLTTFFFELVNFLLLAGFLGWLLFKPVREALEARRGAEQQRTAALGAQEKAIATGRAELEAERVVFDREMTRLRRERLFAAEAEGATIVTRAREAADRERDRANRVRMHLERDKVVQLTASVAAVAREAVARLLTTLQAGELDEALVRAACRQLETATAEAPGAVVVESATPLDEATRAAITDAAGSGAISVEFRVVPQLGAGLRMTTARGLIDASAAGIAAYAERALVTALAGAVSEGEA